MAAASNNPLNIFTCYASEDQHWYQQLCKHLGNLQRQNRIRLLDASSISPGSQWREERHNLIHNANIILLLISPDFFASTDCYQDMEDALALSKTKTRRIIPIFVRPG